MRVEELPDYLRKEWPRSAVQAVGQARDYITQGHRWVVDVDLEKFFDQVNHDMLMSRVARKVENKRLLRLIRRYLNAGIMKEGMVSIREAGTPHTASRLGAGRWRDRYAR